jgi:predicted nucleotidyltransferase
MITNIAIPREAVQGFCQRWNISELALFGSVLRGDFRPDSDVDVLVRFAPDARWTLLDFVRMRDELSEILERKIDLVSRRAVEASQNPLRRRAILESAQVNYGA